MRYIKERALGHDFQLDGENAVGLGIAYLLDTLSVSFNSHQKWDTHQIFVQVNNIDEEGDLLTEEIDIKHAVSVEHIRRHEGWFSTQRRGKIIDGADLWKHRIELFPSLILCDRVGEQLSNYKSSDPIFRQITKKLFLLEDYFSAWSHANFDSTQIACKTTPESTETLSRYNSEHRFVCPDGEKKLFSWHIRTTPGDGRIFFFPDEKLGKGIIGHIGSKLPTVKYPK